jgi:predicted nucleotidyltransferase
MRSGPVYDDDEVNEPLAGDAREAAGRVASALTDVLGDDLVAVYLHGSAVLGGFRWDRSDLDILALSRETLSNEHLHQVVRALASLTYPSNGLEFSLLTAGEALRLEFPAPRFQLHQTTDGRHHAGKVIDGRRLDGDPDLILHLAVCREQGVAIVGPSPRSAFGLVSDGTILSAMRAEIDWAREGGPLEYLVLTAARAWLFATEGRIASKIEAGEWAAERYAEPDVVAAALARQRGADNAVNRDTAERFAEHVQRTADTR